jgi:molybdopterin synthase catalytic subunit
MNLKVTLSDRPISVDSVIRSVRSKSAGAIVTFIGTVRETSEGMRVQRMELEAAKDLAVADLKRIGKLAMGKFDVASLAICHRIGKLRVGDVIVVIAVSSPHRSDAFSASEFVIDELKKTTPIWKKEFGKGKGRWVRQEA